MNQKIKVQKKNLKDEITWQYDGEVLRRESNAVVLEDVPDCAVAVGIPARVIYSTAPTEAFA